MRTAINKIIITSYKLLRHLNAGTGQAICGSVRLVLPVSTCPAYCQLTG
jgi:hypothetical protein